jgi:hypothetical protein
LFAGSVSPRCVAQSLPSSPFLRLSLGAVLLLSGPFTQALSDEDELYLKTFAMNKARDVVAPTLTSQIVC